MNSYPMNRVHLTIQAILFFFPAVFVGMALHEIGHGIGALLTGGSFNGFHVTFFTANSFISGQSSDWQKAICSASGSTFATLIGILLLVNNKRIQMNWALKIFSIYLGFVTLIDLPAHMFLSGMPLRGGDFVGLARATGMPVFLIAAVGLLAVVVVVYIYGAVMAGALSSYVSFDTYRNRLSTFLLFLAVPALISAIGSALDPFNARTGMRGFAVIAAFALCLSIAMAFTRIRSPQALQRLPRSSTIIGVGAFALALIVWLGIFGTRMQPRGILWAAPEERDVSCWNLILTLKPNQTVRADFLMRPTIVDFFWQKQKLAQPNWAIYDSLAQFNARYMLPSLVWTAVEHLQDDTTQFSLFGMDARGARRSTLVATWQPGSTTRLEKQPNLSLNFDSLASGYTFYKLEIRIDPSWHKDSFELNPPSAGKPSKDDPHMLVFADQSLRAIKGIRLALALD